MLQYTGPMAEYLLTLPTFHMMKETNIIWKPGCLNYIFPIDYHYKEQNKASPRTWSWEPWYLYSPPPEMWPFISGFCFLSVRQVPVGDNTGFLLCSSSHDYSWNKMRIWCKSLSAYPLLLIESLRSSYLLVLLCILLIHSENLCIARVA